MEVSQQTKNDDITQEVLDKYNLVRSIGEECVNEDELLQLLKNKKNSYCI